MKRIAVLTSGGDAPGMNAGLRSVVRTAVCNNMSVLGIKRGFAGLIEGDVEELDARSVSGIINRGGTILKTARSEEFKLKSGREKSAAAVKRFCIDGLVILGGDGSFRGAALLEKEGIVPVIGVPATIDNDVAGTDCTIGFDTAVNTAVSAIDRIRDTASSHDRLFIVEVMGRGSGFIALHSAVAGGAEDALIPEVITDLDKTCRLLEEGRTRGKMSSILVVAEGDECGGAFEIAGKIHEKTGYDVRVTILGHILRGGTPSAFDRFLGTKLGDYAVELLLNGESGKMAGISGNSNVSCPLETAFGSKKKIEEGLYGILLKLAI